MTRTMYDGVTPTRIPAGATLVAGYVNGAYANLPALRLRFPHATCVGVAVTAGFDGGVVLDVEKGDASPAKAPGWVRMRRAAGVDPTVYCDTSTWSEVRAAFHAAGVAEPHYWIADWDGEASVPAGAVAKQYRNESGYDLSAVAAYWPGVDPKPGTPPPARPTAPASRYTVKAGDTLSGIAASHHTTWPALASLNHLADPDLIRPGQVLRLT